MERFSESEEAGVEAIIFLQGVAGIQESREDAIAGWRRLAKWEKEVTLRMAERFKKEKEKTA